LLAAAPAGASTREQQAQAAAFGVPVPAPPLRDAVLYHQPSRALLRATASANRYPVNDGAGRTVAIEVSPGCALCTDADPQTMANFLGTLPHRDEISLLTLEMVDPNVEMPAYCGPGALSCYFPGQDLIVTSGSDGSYSDGADRAFVIAHEYGHHVANHRNNPPFEPTIDYGPKRWATYQRVCEGVRSGAYFPGDEGDHYYENPGEAFAESFAFNRFPSAPVPWEWNPSLKPDATAFAALRRDTTDPWTRRTKVRKRGRVPRHKVAKKFTTPLDGTLTVKLRGPFDADLDLLLRDSAGHLLGRSRGLGSKERLTTTICGESTVRAVVKRGGGRGGRFKLTAIRP
jgi:hypothetical protein